MRGFLVGECQIRVWQRGKGGLLIGRANLILEKLGFSLC